METSDRETSGSEADSGDEYLAELLAGAAEQIGSGEEVVPPAGLRDHPELAPEFKDEVAILNELRGVWRLDSGATVRGDPRQARWPPFSHRSRSVPKILSTSGMETDFIRERMVFFAKACIVVLLGYNLIAFILTFLPVPEVGEVPRHFASGNLANFCACGIELAVWLTFRERGWSQRILSCADAAAAFLVCLFYALAYVIESRHFGVKTDEFRALLTATNFLIARSVTVPGPAGRALWVGVVAMLPVVVGQYLTTESMRAAAEYLLWCAVTVTASTVASWRIFGLHRDVRRFGKYTLEKEIGRGRMGVVYRARHSMLHRPTAVKLLPPEKAGLEAIAQFEKEVQSTCLLSHQNTIRIFDYGRTPDNTFYYAMEYLPGLDLEEVVERSGPLPPGRVVHVLLQICGSLAEAHEAGLIHRDIKASNVLLAPRYALAFDAVKVLDFGLVRTIERPGSPASAGQDRLAGTPLYIAPEAVRSPSSQDRRSDLYAVGVLGFFLLTGRHPFEGTTIEEVLRHHCETPVPSASAIAPAGVPSDLEAVVLACLEKDPGRRPQRAEHLAASLQACSCARVWTKVDALAWWDVIEKERAAGAEVPSSSGGTTSFGELEGFVPVR